MEYSLMKMNFLEKLAMNNPIRFYIQRNFEVPLLEKLGAQVEGMNVLEVGCAHGVGTKVLLDKWKVKKVYAMDLDEDMLKKARQRLAGYSEDRLELHIADVTQIDVADHSFDAVVNFAAIHHVPNWQSALSEISRVLKPGGLFIFQEVTAQWILRWPYSVLFEHPMENRFSGQQFIDELEHLSFTVDNNWVERGGGDFIFAVAKKDQTEGKNE